MLPFMRNPAREFQDEASNRVPLIGREFGADELTELIHVDARLDVDELGDLGLTADEQAKIVAFMKTLSDGWW